MAGPGPSAAESALRGRGIHEEQHPGLRPGPSLLWTELSPLAPVVGAAWASPPPGSGHVQRGGRGLGGSSEDSEAETSLQGPANGRPCLDTGVGRDPGQWGPEEPGIGATGVACTPGGARALGAGIPLGAPGCLLSLILAAVPPGLGCAWCLRGAWELGPGLRLVFAGTRGSWGGGCAWCLRGGAWELGRGLHLVFAGAHGSRGGGSAGVRGRPPWTEGLCA